MLERRLPPSLSVSLRSMTLNYNNPNFPLLDSTARLSSYGSSRAALPYQRVSTDPAPELDKNSNTPYVDSINRGEFSYYPSELYAKEPLFLPKFQASGVWNITREYGPPGSSHPPSKESKRWNGDPKVYSMITGGQLSPEFSHYVPPNFAPGPLGPFNGISYVQCKRFPGDTNRKAVLDPPNMANPWYYE